MKALLVWGGCFILTGVTTVSLGLDAAGGFFCGVSWGIVAILIEAKIK
nr:MAG: hypothetical protein [Bacteriophage sp.]